MDFTKIVIIFFLQVLLSLRARRFFNYSFHIFQPQKSAKELSSLRVISLLMYYRHIVPIFENPGAASWEDEMFPGDNLL